MNELTHSGRTVADVLAHEEKIRASLDAMGFERGPEHENLMLLVFSRELLVEKMATAVPFSRLWDEISREIVGVECLLAPHGLV